MLDLIMLECYTYMQFDKSRDLEKSPPTPIRRTIGNSKSEGSLKSKIFNGKYEPKLEFKEGLEDEGSN